MGCEHLTSLPRLLVVKLICVQIGLLPVHVEVSASVLAALIWRFAPAPALSLSSALVMCHKLPLMTMHLASKCMHAIYVSLMKEECRL